MNQTKKNGQKTNFGSNFSLFWSKFGLKNFCFEGITSTWCYTSLQAITVCNFKESQWSKLEKMIKNLVSGPILAQICLPSQKTFFRVLLLQNITHCCKLSLYAISRKTTEPNLRKWHKKTSFWTAFEPFGPNLGPSIFFFMYFTSTRC